MCITIHIVIHKTYRYDCRGHRLTGDRSPNSGGELQTTIKHIHRLRLPADIDQCTYVCCTLWLISVVFLVDCKSMIIIEQLGAGTFIILLPYQSQPEARTQHVKHWGMPYNTSHESTTTLHLLKPYQSMMNQNLEEIKIQNLAQYTRKQDVSIHFQRPYYYCLHAVPIALVML